MLVKKQISYLKINVQFMFNQLLASETADSRHYGGCFHLCDEKIIIIFVDYD